MNSNPLADLIEKHRTTLAHAVASEALRRQLKPYQGVPLYRLAALVEATLEMLGRYVQTGEPTEYKAYVVELVQRHVAQSHDTDEVLSVADIIYEQLERLIAQEWPGEVHKTERTRAMQKLNGIRVFGHITFKAARLELRRTQSQQDK